MTLISVRWRGLLLTPSPLSPTTHTQLQLLAVVYSSFSSADKNKFRKLFLHKRYATGTIFPGGRLDPSNKLGLTAELTHDYIHICLHPQIVFLSPSNSNPLTSLHSLSVLPPLTPSLPPALLPSLLLPSSIPPPLTLSFSLTSFLLSSLPPSFPLILPSLALSLSPREALRHAYKVLASPDGIRFHDFLLFMQQYKPRTREHTATNKLILFSHLYTILPRPISLSDIYTMYIEGKIYSWTDIISDRRLQRSKHGSNCARSSEQQDMLAVG